MTIYVGNVFTFGFLKDRNVNITCREISWAEFDTALEQEDYINYMGHEDVARMVGLERNRATIRAEKGDTIYIAQYDGPRLPEGATTLPEGATLIPLKVTIQ